MPALVRWLTGRVGWSVEPSPGVMSPERSELGEESAGLPDDPHRVWLSEGVPSDYPMV